MNSFTRMASVFLAALLLTALPAAAGTVTGAVRNGTTGMPAVGVDVTLLQLQGGMQEISTTKADPQGRFRLQNASLGQQPMLLRVVYRGVTFFEPVPPGQPDSTVNVEIFDPTADPGAFHVLHRIIAVEPQSSSLLIGEEFDIENPSNPPKAFYKADGCFLFHIPPGSALNQVEAWGPSGIPVVQGTVNKGHNTYAIVYPFRPGQNGVRISYHLDYAAHQATLTLPSDYPVEMAMVLAPPAVHVSAEGFASSGNERGWDVYTRQAVAAGAPTLLSVSGIGPVPSGDAVEDQSSGAPGAAQPNPDQGGAASAVTPVAQAFPPRLDSLKWILVAGFASLFILGAFLLWWRSRVPAPLSAAAVPSPPSGGESHLRSSVDEIKELLFRLELRRQAGTLSEEEYLVQRRRAELALRALLHD